MALTAHRKAPASNHLFTFRGGNSTTIILSHICQLKTVMDPANHTPVDYKKGTLVVAIETGRVRCLLCKYTLKDKTYVIKRHFANQHKYNFVPSSRGSYKRKRSNKEGSPEEDEGESTTDEQSLLDSSEVHIQGQEDLPALYPSIKIEPVESHKEGDGLQIKEVAGAQGTSTSEQSSDPIEGMFKGLMDMFRGLKSDTQRRVMKELNSTVIDAVYSDQKEKEG